MPVNRGVEVPARTQSGKRTLGITYEPCPLLAQPPQARQYWRPPDSSVHGTPHASSVNRKRRALLRRVLVTLGAVSGLLLTLWSVGFLSVMPGENLDFRDSVVAGAGVDTMFFKHARPDREAELQLRLRAFPAAAGSLSAAVEGGVALHVRAREVARDEWQVQLNAASDTSGRPRFTWPDDHAVILEIWRGNRGAGQPPQLRSWKAVLGTHDYDSSGRSRWRRAVFWFSVVLFGLSLIGVAIERWTALGDGPEETFTPRRSLELIIASLTAPDDVKTRQVRLLAENTLLHGMSREEAFKELGMESRSWEARELSFIMRPQVEMRLTSLAAIMQQAARKIASDHADVR